MSKVKPPKKPKGAPNKHLHARTAFLYQAATYLTLQTDRSPLALGLGSDLQQVSRKAQLHVSVELKRSICKSCNSILVPGRTATQKIENDSRGGRKPWADVLVVQCDVCGGKKRFPVGAKRQGKKGERGLLRKEFQKEGEPCTETDVPATPHSDAVLTGAD
jgi:ribonuclease P protein subunit RPR2